MVKTFKIKPGLDFQSALRLTLVVKNTKPPINLVK